MVVFSFFYARSSKYYSEKIIIPTILFTYVSFGLFLLDFQMGERLGFGMSALLIIVAQEIVTNDHITISNELLWITCFIQISTYFTFAALLESIFVAWIYFKAGRKIRHDNEARNESLDDGNVEDYRNKNVQEKLAERSKNIVAFDSSDESAKHDEEHNNIKIDDDPPLKTQEKEKSQHRSFMNSSISRVFRSYNPPSFSLKVSKTETEAKKLVGRIDYICLVVFPTLYTIFLIVIFTVGLDRMDDTNLSWITGVELHSEL